MTLVYSILAGFGCYVAGFLTASIFASGKIGELLEEIDRLEVENFGGWRK